MNTELVNNTSMSIVISQPTTAPFVQQAARALYEESALESYVTTLACRPGMPLKALGRREVTEVPFEKVKRIPFAELMRLATGRVDSNGIATDRVWEWAEKRFDQKVAALLRRDMQAVYCYEHAALSTFRRAKELGLSCIYDVPAPEHQFTHDLMRVEFEKYPEIRRPYHDHIERLERDRTQRRREEFALADLVIANSEFTRESYIQSGFDADKIVVVPYGAPPVHPQAESGGSTTESLQLLWAGTFNIRKGAHYLLEAIRSLGENVSLKIFGSMQLPRRLVSDLPAGIHISSTIPREELYREYLAADLLVFPTLCDGFGMVVTEALAHGLPVLTTQNAGASFFIREGQSGFVIAPGSAGAIANVLGEYRSQPQVIRQMRKAASESARQWQWSDYRKKLFREIQQVVYG